MLLTSLTKNWKVTLLPPGFVDICLRWHRETGLIGTGRQEFGKEDNISGNKCQIVTKVQNEVRRDCKRPIRLRHSVVQRVELLTQQGAISTWVKSLKNITNGKVTDCYTMMKKLLSTETARSLSVLDAKGKIEGKSRGCDSNFASILY